MAAALGSAAWRARVLAEYRTALRLSAALPAAAERETALAGLRAEMRAHVGLKEEVSWAAAWCVCVWMAPSRSVPSARPPRSHSSLSCVPNTRTRARTPKAKACAAHGGPERAQGADRGASCRAALSIRLCARSRAQDRALDELRRLAARSGFLRMVTPARSRRARDEVGGTYVMRDGRLVRGTGETQGVRATDGSVSFEDARARNMADMQRMNFGRKQDLSALRPLI